MKMNLQKKKQSAADKRDIIPRLTPADEDLKEEKTAEDHANDMFNELIDKDFTEPVPKNHGQYVATCKMVTRRTLENLMRSRAQKRFQIFIPFYGDPKDFGEFDEIESPEEIPDIYPVGDPREFFDFYDVNYKPTTKTIEFADQIGNPTKFAVLPPSEELYRKETSVDSNGNKIDTKKGIEENHKDLWGVFDARMVLENELKNVSVLFLGMWKSSATHHIEVEKSDFNASLEHMPCEVL
ncbi:hypothetical protein Tco_1129051 [Tanacetum coccineum]